MDMTLYNTKFGYNGYIFKPEDWIMDGSKRLSTCFGKYKQQQYGSLSLKRLIGLFNTFCPYEVVWVNLEEYKFNSAISNSSVSCDWMNKNICGYWRDLTFFDKLSDGSSLGLYRSCIRFEKESDAILFKLTWVGK